MYDRRPATIGVPFARFPRIVVIFVLLFWVAQFGLVTLQRYALGTGDTLWMLVPRAVMMVIAMGISFVIAGLQIWASRRGIHTRVTVVLAIIAPPLHTVINFYVFKALVPGANTSPGALFESLPSMLQWIFSYAALCAMIYALLLNAKVQERERRIGQLERVANEAQLRALRYQLNPHFMFNTLNSVAALISTGEPRAAESMVENLADFLRAGLSLDPLADVTLAREIDLQSRYLEIEQVRFADRLRVRTEIDAQASGMLVPALVTQPLIENAIRHAVASTSEVVEILIQAWTTEGRLHVSVTNDLPDERPGKRGTGVGLANVEGRLRARFGDDATFTCGPVGERQYRVAFAVPAMRQEQP